MKIALSFLFLSMNTISIAFAQIKFDVSGTVKDLEGLPLPGASILISNYQIGAVTNMDGNFKIVGLNPGNYDILVQIIGYIPAQMNVIINDQPLDIMFVLKPVVTQLNEVVIRPDPNRLVYLQQFKEAFFGTSPNAKSCKLLNPEIINFNYDVDHKTLTAKADDFLIIENRALGYRIRYLLKIFEKNDETKLVTYFGFPYFEELHQTDRRLSVISRKRLEAFQGSTNHFFSKLFENKFEESGFFVAKVLTLKNPKKLPDSLSESKIKYFDDLAANNNFNSFTDSLEYWHKIKNAPDTLEVIDSTKFNVAKMILSINPDLKALNFTEALFVVFKKEKESKLYRLRSNYQLPRPIKYKDFQVSILYQPMGPIAFYRNGTINNPLAGTFEGYWAYEKIGDLMPSDYVAKYK